MRQQLQLRFFYFLLLAGTWLLLPGWMLAQNEGANWYFGRNSGVRFQGDSIVALNDGQMNSEEACATISDKNGNLLFYTNGVDVWNRQHTIMLNGGGLTNFVNNTQCLIAPLPGSDSIFYIFTTMDAFQNPSMGFGYHIVDLAGDNGLGEVVSRENTLFAPSTEKVCMTRAENGCDLWVLAHEGLNNVFRCYKLTCEGLDTNAVVSAVGLPDGNGYGYMKFSQDGRNVVFAEGFGDFVMVLDFDRVNGWVSNPINLTGVSNPYGVEFSPDKSKLYISSIDIPRQIFQADLSSGIDSVILNTMLTIPFSPGTLPGAIQLGINGKIYITQSPSRYLSGIEFPDSSFPFCNFFEESVFFFATNDVNAPGGLPHIYPPAPVSTLSIDPGTESCIGDSVPVYASHSFLPDSVYWVVNHLPTGEETMFQGDSILIPLTRSGAYEGRMVATWGCETDTQSFSIRVTSPPEIILPDSFLQCGKEPILLSPLEIKYVDSIHWSTSDTMPEILVHETGTFTLTVSNRCGSQKDSTVVVQNDAEGVFIPNVFTPNGDGVNDLFGIEVQNPTNYHLQVFDRWGRQIFNSFDPNFLWGGDNNVPGVYFYLLKANDCKNEPKGFKGWISLLK